MRETQWRAGDRAGGKAGARMDTELRRNKMDSGGGWRKDTESLWWEESP